MLHRLPPAQSSSSTQPIDPVLRERIRQARWGFNLSAGFASLSATAALAGVVLLFSGHLPQGAVATFGGLTSTAHCMKLSKEANDRLDRLIYNTSMPALPENNHD